MKKRKTVAAQTFYVIDDEPAIREILQEQLESWFDCSVLAFGSVSDALDALKQSPILPNVILSDVRMPGESGFSLKSALTAKGIDVPVILITGLDGEEILEDDTIVMSKPINMKHLKGHLDKFV